LASLLSNTSNSNSISETTLLNESEVTRYLTTVLLEIEVTKFLISQSKTALCRPHPSTLSLFGASSQKSALAELILVLHNFDLAFQILQEFRLPLPQIYLNAAQKIVRKSQIKLNEFLRYIKGTVSDEELDQVTLTCIEVLAVELHEPKTAEKYVPKLSSDNTKVKALIICQKLKAAYLCAVQSGNTNLIECIKREAQNLGDKTVLDLCSKYLLLSQETSNLT